MVIGDNVHERISDKPEYNNNLSKAKFGSIAHWSTLAAANKLNNKQSNVDTYKKRQQQLSSNLFDMSQEYAHYAPTTKN